MTVQAGGESRDVIPRWRAFEASLETGELRSLNPAMDDDPDVGLAQLREDFEIAPSLYVAADFLSALVAARQLGAESDDLAEFILSNGSDEVGLSAFAQRALEGNLGPQTEGDGEFADKARNRVATARHILALDPRNSVRWVDLSLAHLTLGNHAAAQRGMTTALSLSPTNRFVLRSAARFAISDEDYDRAFDLLSRSGLHEHDPWILAATISAAQLAERRMNLSKPARAMLISQQFAPRDLSELAGEMATLEVRAGRIKQAKALFAQSLSDPNENAVAQAEWATQAGGFELSAAQLSIDRGYEARSRAFTRAGEWSAATLEGISWQADEPFSLEPALNTSYTASLGLEDYATALRVAEIGLRVHPYESLLRNNAAYAAASQGDVETARMHASQVTGFDDEDGFNTFQATEGLILFRSGNEDAGREKYRLAVEGFAHTKRRDLASIATSLWAMEEVSARTRYAQATTDLARNLAAGSSHPETLLLVDRLNSLVSTTGFVPL